MMRIKIQYIVFSLLNICFYFTAISQEYIKPLDTNPVLFSKRAEPANQAKSASSVNTFWLFESTPLLPFEDDFSRHSFTNYNADVYPASSKSDSIWHNYKINFNIPGDTLLYYMLDTSFTYFFDANTNAVTRVPNPPFSVTFYQNKLAPNLITLTKELWPLYDSIYFNPTTLVPETLAVQPDTFLTYLTDTLYYIKVPPESAHWKNQEIYVNNTYPIRPPSIGVATFDGIDSTGYPYNFNIATSQGLADRLNSTPFDLTSYSPVDDSLYFSFYYQPTGLGNSPEPEDSLKLEFKDKNGVWKRVWGKSGFQLTADSLFYRKVIPIVDSSYFHANFEFRFTNYATLSGNLDHWHIDYVRIDKSADTTISDITWVYPGKSLFNEYQQIAFKHYNGQAADYFKNSIRNLFTSAINVSYDVKIRDYYTNQLFNVLVSNVQFNPLVINSCLSCVQILNPLIGNSFSFPVNGACSKYEIKNVIENISPEPNQLNDTLFYTQIFGDYFAYDDGSAEAAYGLTTAASQLASKFKANVSDTLRAIRIFFNPQVVNSAQVNEFKLIVWAVDANGKPGIELYRKSVYDTPDYNHQINGYIEYPIDQTLILNDNFFIGFEQLGTAELNIGFDRNTNSMAKNYYNSTGTWYNTQFPGSWMIRPVFGYCSSFITSDNTNVISNIKEVNFYPNPASNEISFQSNLLKNFEVKIYNQLGTLICDKQLQSGEKIGLNSFANGIYFVQITNATENYFSSRKLIISN